MFTGMLAGMVVGMAGAMAAVPVETALFLGGVSGVAGICFIWVCNILLRGITKEGESGNA
jgi:hypothetical protein